MPVNEPYPERNDQKKVDLTENKVTLNNMEHSGNLIFIKEKISYKWYL